MAQTLRLTATLIRGRKDMKISKKELLKGTRYLYPLIFVVIGAVIITGCSALLEKRPKLTWEPGIMVTTLYGKIKGYESSPDTYAWKAIPYAKPPVGELRWKAPQDPDPWTDVREAAEFCDQCTQFTRGLAIAGKEDCLYLNIWRPKSAEKDLPVYLWIHGGGNSINTASHNRYDGVKIARKSNMVIVTINYRLGPMGWFTHPGLRHGKNAKDDSGNYGTLDIIKALEWVRDNIEAFGGNSGNITIAGESAGAFNVLSLLVSPIAKGHFHKAISQSGRERANPTSTGDAHVNAVVERLLVNDGTVADKSAAKAYRTKMSNTEIERYLRSKTVGEILKGHEMWFGPMIKFPYIFVDSTVISKDGFDALKDPNRYNQVPIILGTNKEEMKLFMAFGSQYDKLDHATYQKAAQARSNKWKLSGVDNVARKLSAHKTQPGVYAYQFNYGAYNPDGYNAWPVDHKGVNYALKFGASHVLEIPFFWGNRWFFGLEKLLFREDNRMGYEALTDAMMSYVGEFTRTGKPGAAGGVLWKAWSNTEGESKRIFFDANGRKALIGMSKK
jgi:para-nitrobenzyl esterase